MNELEELKKENEYLRKCLDVASGFVLILKCQSCKNPHADGYICHCGRDNSFSNEEWEQND